MTDEVTSERSGDPPDPVNLARALRDHTKFLNSTLLLLSSASIALVARDASSIVGSFEAAHTGISFLAFAVSTVAGVLGLRCQLIAIQARQSGLNARDEQRFNAMLAGELRRAADDDPNQESQLTKAESADARQSTADGFAERSRGDYVKARDCDSRAITYTKTQLWSWIAGFAWLVLFPVAARLVTYVGAR